MNLVQKAFLTTLTMIMGLTGAFAANAGAKEGGGFANIQLINFCTETNPANPSAPLVAYLTKTAGRFDLIVRRKSLTEAEAAAGDYVYSGTLMKNNQIVCFAPCAFYENKEDGVVFNTTTIGNLIDARFESAQGSLAFTCE